MNLVFRKFNLHNPPSPGPCEIILWPVLEEHQERRELAVLILEKGLTVFGMGQKPIEQIVVYVDPTLDDLLAAAFAMRLLESKPLPQGAALFARYAALVRKGHKPSTLQPENSLEGMFLALRNISGKNPGDLDGKDLTNPETSKLFAAAWFRFADTILLAAEEGKDPFKFSIFEEGADFAEERTFLVGDQQVYRLDVQRGEKWIIEIPGGPKFASGLLLRNPKSLLFPFWSRRDTEAPVGGTYLFLAVFDDQEGWIFSTDPLQRLQIQSLAENLQASEATKKSNTLLEDPWYDGKQHGNTLVAEPHRRTKLSEPEILGIVKSWCRARPVGRGKHPPFIKAAIGLAAGMVIVGAAWWYHRPLKPLDDSGPAQEVWTRQLGDRSEPGGREKQVTAPPQTRDLQPGLNNFIFEPENPFPTFATKVRIEVEIKSNEGALPMDLPLSLKVNNQQEIPRPISKRTENEIYFVPMDVEFNSSDKGKNPLIQVAVKNGTTAPIPVTIQLRFPFNSTLFALTVGVSKYSNGADLRYAAKDAQSLAEAFKKQKSLYHQIKVNTLLDGQATRSNILGKLAWLDRNVAPYDLAIVTLCGHGQVEKGEFFFIPYDFDNDDSKRIPWTDIQRPLCSLPSNVFVVLDTCHSGAATRAENLKTDRAIVVLAASLSEQVATETAQWGHGALTLAILEAFDNRYLASPGKAQLPGELVNSVITLKDLDYYVTRRVPELVREGQTVTSNSSGDANLLGIRIASLKP